MNSVSSDFYEIGALGSAAVERNGFPKNGKLKGNFRYSKSPHFVFPHLASFPVTFFSIFFFFAPGPLCPIKRNEIPGENDTFNLMRKWNLYPLRRLFFFQCQNESD